MPSFGFSWQWIIVITMTKYFEDFQEPAGHLYPSSDVRRFVPTLQPDKKLPFIWHSLHSGPMVHFIKNQESQLFDLGFEEEALQRALPPSTAHPFLFLAGMGGAGYSCPATALGGILAQLGVGGNRRVTGIGEPGSHYISWCLRIGKRRLDHRQDMSVMFLPSREEGLSLGWARSGAARGLSVAVG